MKRLVKIPPIQPLKALRVSHFETFFGPLCALIGRLKFIGRLLLAQPNGAKKSSARRRLVAGLVAMSIVVTAPVASVGQIYTPQQVYSSSPKNRLEDQQEAQQERLAKRAFLLDLYDRVYDYMLINRNYLSVLKTCFEGENTDILGIRYNCEEEKAKVRKTALYRYPVMRRYLALINLTHQGFHRTLMRAFREHLAVQKLGPAAALARGWVEPKLNVERWYVQHPLRAVWVEENLPMLPFTDDEIQAALNGQYVLFKGSERWAPGLEARYENLNEIEQLYCEVAFGKNHPGCQSFHVKYSVQDRKLYFENRPGYEEWMQKAISENPYDREGVEFEMVQKMKGLQQYAEKQIQNKYLSLLQQNPYIAFLTSAEPSDQEFHHAFKVMYNYAQKNLEDHEKSRHVYEQDEVPEAELRKLMAYSPVALTLLSEKTPGRRMSQVAFDYKKVFEVVKGEYALQDSINKLIHIVTLVAANLVLCPGGGKVITVLGRARSIVKFRRWGELFNPICFAMTTIPINGWLLYEAIEGYEKTYSQIFSSADGRYRIADVNSLPAAQRSLFWAAVMSPMGTSAALKGFASSGVNISPKLAELIAKLPEPSLKRDLPVFIGLGEVGAIDRDTFGTGPQ
jgi:hypothetical protein